jgi:hypothetical protein
MRLGFLRKFIWPAKPGPDVSWIPKGSWFAPSTEYPKYLNSKWKDQLDQFDQAYADFIDAVSGSWSYAEGKLSPAELKAIYQRPLNRKVFQRPFESLRIYFNDKKSDHKK